MNSKDLDIAEFLQNGWDLKSHLARYLGISIDVLERRLPNSSNELASLHPSSLPADQATSFYETKVGTGHLFELAAWHLNSAVYIGETLLLQQMFAKGIVLDFGGGIGTHALFAAALKDVDHVWFVDLNPHNRSFVEHRAKLLGLTEKISIARDLESINEKYFDTFICLDVLEHLPDPSAQILRFLERMKPDAKVLLNWYFFKGNKGEYPFHFDDPLMIEDFFRTLQENFIEVFHPLLITTRVYKAWV